MGGFAFFGLLLLSGVANLFSFMGIAFGGTILEEMTKLGTNLEKFLIRLLEVLMLVHMTLVPLAGMVLVGIFVFGNRALAAGGVKYMFVLPVVSIALMLVCAQLAAKYK